FILNRLFHRPRASVSERPRLSFPEGERGGVGPLSGREVRGPTPLARQERALEPAHKGDAMRPSEPLYFDDISAGQTFHSGSVTVDREGLEAFAADFDPQPFHLDEAAARASLFGRQVASGWHTAALTMRLLVDGDLRIAGGLIGMGVEAM